MQITELRIRKVEDEGKLRAYVTVTFDNCFVVHNVKIIEGKSGLFIAMPSRKTANGEYKDVAHPISPEFRTELQNKIVSEYVWQFVILVKYAEDEFTPLVKHFRFKYKNVAYILPSLLTYAPIRASAKGLNLVWVKFALALKNTGISTFASLLL